MDFQAFINDIKENHWQVHGVELYKSGKLLHSYGDTTETKYPIYSVTKSILSIAVGMAWDEGRFDVDKCILDYLPASVLTDLTQAQRQSFQKITVHRLMTMSVKGFPFRPEGESWLKFSLHCPPTYAEIIEFDYSNISAYLVGVALANATKEDVSVYLTRKLFEPLGIENPVFTHCPDGYFYGASGMELSVHDLSQIGLLFYHGGRVGGKQLLSEAYIRKATSVQQMNKEGGYGYFIWKYRDGFSLNGKWKQRCYVLPKEELVITYLSDIRDDSNTLKCSMERHLSNS